MREQEMVAFQNRLRWGDIQQKPQTAALTLKSTVCSHRSKICTGLERGFLTLSLEVLERAVPVSGLLIRGIIILDTP